MNKFRHKIFIWFLKSLRKSWHAWLKMDLNSVIYPILIQTFQTRKIYLYLQRENPIYFISVISFCLGGVLSARFHFNILPNTRLKVWSNNSSVNIKPIRIDTFVFSVNKFKIYYFMNIAISSLKKTKWVGLDSFYFFPGLNFYVY